MLSLRSESHRSSFSLTKPLLKKPHQRAKASKKQLTTSEGTTSKEKKSAATAGDIIPRAASALSQKISSPALCRGQPETFTRHQLTKPNSLKCLLTWRRKWQRSKLWSTVNGEKQSRIEKARLMNERRRNAKMTNSSSRSRPSRTPEYTFIIRETYCHEGHKQWAASKSEA